MPKRLKSFNQKHDQLRRRAKCAAPGQRKVRDRELVHYVARLMAPRIVRKRGMPW